ncbi:MAG: metal-dependent transcriptional regulator [Clostridia bacterium]|nr:metal-dependent transcriptional regulator [Clostridia bacterium]
MRLQESGEMYLETILLLNQKSESVRSIDVCEYMGFSKPSVSRAVGLLKTAGYIEVSKNGFLTLTETGRAVAEKIYARHTLLTDLLVRAGVSEKTAAEDACKIEHCISDETFDALSRLSCKV